PRARPAERPQRGTRTGERDRGGDPARARRRQRRHRAHRTMKLCMFTPVALDLERGWPGKIDGDRVIQVAAQTLQAFFTGGGTAREHAVYRLADVDLRAPVLRPPSIRFFDDEHTFAFGNTASIYGPVDVVRAPGEPEARFCVAAVIGAD